MTISDYHNCQERAEVAERNLEDIRNQLVDIIEVERDQKKR